MMTNPDEWADAPRAEFTPFDQAEPTQQSLSFWLTVDMVLLVYCSSFSPAEVRGAFRVPLTEWELFFGPTKYVGIFPQLNDDGTLEEGTRVSVADGIFSLLVDAAGEEWKELAQARLEAAIPVAVYARATDVPYVEALRQVAKKDDEHQAALTRANEARYAWEICFELAETGEE